MSAWAPTISPPPPIPCSARKAMSCGMDAASPHSTAPTTNAPIAACMTGLRPNRSPSLPYMGMTTVAATR